MPGGLAKACDPGKKIYSVKEKSSCFLIGKTYTSKDSRWPLFAACVAYAMNTFASVSFDWFSPYGLAFVRKPLIFTGMTFPPLEQTKVYRKYVVLF